MKASFAKGAAELLTGYSSQIKAADDFNDKVGGTDGLVGRAFTFVAQELVYVPLTREAANLTGQNWDKMVQADSAFDKVGHGITTAAAGIATAHMASRVLASAITLVPNVRENLEKEGII